MRIQDAGAPITLEIPAGIRARSLERMAASVRFAPGAPEFTIPVRFDGEAIVGPASPGACRKCFNLRRAAAAATPDLGRGLSELARSNRSAALPDAFADWVEAAARRVLAHAAADLRGGVGRVVVVTPDGRARRYMFRPRYDCKECRLLLRAGRPSKDAVSQTLASPDAGLLRDPSTTTGWPQGAHVWTAECQVSNHRFSPRDRSAGQGCGLERAQARLSAVSSAVARYAVSAIARTDRGGELRGRDLFSGMEIRLSATDVLAEGAAQPDAWATAARRSWSEAVDAALLEVARNDAFMAVWFEARLSLQVDRPEDPAVGAVWEAVKATGTELQLRLAPAVSGAALAIATLVQPTGPKFVLGLGCARDPVDAAREALVQAVGMRRDLARRHDATSSGAYSLACNGFDREASKGVFGAGPIVSWGRLRAWMPKPAVPLPRFADQMVADGFAPVVVDITPADVRAEGWFVVRAGVPSLRALRPGSDPRVHAPRNAAAVLHPLV